MASIGDEVEQALLYRIRSGRYPVAGRLPSVRQLAREFGVNKNTVAHVVQSLARRGYLTTAVGKGVFVAESLPSGDGPEPRLLAEAQLARLLWRLRLLGLSAAEARALTEDCLRQVYSPNQVRLAFVECNDYDAETLGRQVQEGIGLPAPPLLLAPFLADPAAACHDLDIVATTFYHLAAVRDAVTATGAATEVVGVHAPPTADALLRIARAPRGSRVTVVCTEETTLNTVVNQVHTYNPGIEVTACVPAAGHDLAAALATADFVVDTHTSHDAIVGAGCDVPVITLGFAVEPQSIEYLRGRVGECLGRRAATGDAAAKPA